MGAKEESFEDGSSPTEKSPLLAKLHIQKRRSFAGKVVEAGGLKPWWQGTSETFRFAVTYSARAAVAVGITVVLPLLIPHGRKRFAEHHLPMDKIVCNMLFTIGPNVGSTVANSVSAVVGSLIAGLMVTFLHTMYPGRDHSEGFEFCACCSMVYIFVLLLLNIDANIRFWAVGEYLFHMMAFLDPDAHLSYRVLTRPDIVVGALLAVLCSALPHPVSASGALRRSAESIAEQLFSMTRNAILYYCGDDTNLEHRRLVAELHDVKTALDSAKGPFEASWYECFGFGPMATMRLRAGEVLDELQIDMLHMQPLVTVISRGRFDESHSAMVALWRDPMLAVSERMQALVTVVVQAQVSSTDAAVEEESIQLLEKELRTALAELVRVTDVREGVPMSHETTGAYAVVFALTALARHVLARTENLRTWRYQPSESAPSIVFSRCRRVFTIRVEDLSWACRNFITLLICVLIGVYAHLRTSFFVPFTAGPAYLVVLLLSRHSDSHFSSAKTQISMVVMAKVVGHAGWTLYGHCTLGSQLMTLLLSVSFVQCFMYFAYSGGENSAFATRMAAIGVLELLQPCSDARTTFEKYAGCYHEIIDNVVGVVVLLLVDSALGSQAHSLRAADGLLKAMERYRQIFAGYLSGQKCAQVAIRDVRVCQSMIAFAVSMADEAQQEAPLWREPFRPDLFTDLTLGWGHLCQHFLNLVCMLRDDVKVLVPLPAFRATCTQLQARLDETAELAVAVLERDWDEVAAQAKRLSCDAGAFYVGVEGIPLLIEELQANGKWLAGAMRKQGTLSLDQIPEPGVEAGADTEERHHGAQLGLLVETLVSVAELLGRLQQRIILVKNR